MAEERRFCACCEGRKPHEVTKETTECLECGLIYTKDQKGRNHDERKAKSYEKECEDYLKDKGRI